MGSDSGGGEGGGGEGGVAKIQQGSAALVGELGFWICPPCSKSSYLASEMPPLEVAVLEVRGTRPGPTASWSAGALIRCSAVVCTLPYSTAPLNFALLPRRPPDFLRFPRDCTRLHQIAPDMVTSCMYVSSHSCSATVLAFPYSTAPLDFEYLPRRRPDSLRFSRDGTRLHQICAYLSLQQ